MASVDADGLGSSWYDEVFDLERPIDAAPLEGLVRADCAPHLDVWRELCEGAYAMSLEQQEALLRYARALKAGGVDREWLGREVRAAYWFPAPVTVLGAWEEAFDADEIREDFRRIGARLFALGQAHGDPLRGEGPALLEAAEAIADAMKLGDVPRIYLAAMRLAAVVARIKATQ